MSSGIRTSTSSNTPGQPLSCSKIIKLLKRLYKILKAVLSRCLFALFCFVAIWRVTQALQNDNYWLLLLTLIPLAVETIHAITKKETNQFKWLTPSVLFFLICAIPCIWLLELKLLDERLMQNNVISPISDNNSSLSDAVNNFIGINAEDEEWTLGLEQVLIFVLVLAKWIAPKGQLSLDELSQLLLVNIAAGADILELLETFGEEKVQQNSDIVYLIMTAWTWSLLQFTVVLTASKTLPELQEPEEEVVMQEPTSINGDARTAAAAAVRNGNRLSNGTSNASTNGGPGYEKNNGAVSTLQNDENVIQIENESSILSKEKGKMHDRLRADEELEAFVEGRRCFDCFCCYNEIWGMTMSIIFQDGPFFILRLVILFHYQVVTHMNIFFTGKNVFVIILLLNRIRVVLKEQRQPWKSHMKKVKKERRLKKDKARKQRGLPLKKKSSHQKNKSIFQKPRWLIWRA